jgi:hypothetical protein
MDTWFWRRCVGKRHVRSLQYVANNSIFERNHSLRRYCAPELLDRCDQSINGACVDSNGPGVKPSGNLLKNPPPDDLDSQAPRRWEMAAAEFIIPSWLNCPETDAAD